MSTEFKKYDMTDIIIPKEYSLMIYELFNGDYGMSLTHSKEQIRLYTRRMNTFDEAIEYLMKNSISFIGFDKNLKHCKIIFTDDNEYYKTTDLAETSDYEQKQIQVMRIINGS